MLGGEIPVKDSFREAGKRLGKGGRGEKGGKGVAAAPAFGESVLFQQPGDGAGKSILLRKRALIAVGKRLFSSLLRIKRVERLFNFPNGQGALCLLYTSRCV